MLCAFISLLPQEGSHGQSAVKYHYEGLEQGGDYRNYGITPEELDYFNINILSIERVGE